MMGVFDKIGRVVGPRRVRQTTAIVSVAMLVLGGGAAGLLFSPSLDSWAPGLTDQILRVDVAGDTDGDGLPDALENQLGSDPDQPHTMGGSVPDGWLFHWYGRSIDWNDTSLLHQPALDPPSSELPPPLQGDQSIPFLSVQELYQLETGLRDPDGSLGSWWLAKPALDPSEWDNDADGLADVWLAARGIDPLASDPSDDAPGDPSMTLQQKYDLGLDPSTRDTDRDGIFDLEEIDGTLRDGDVSQAFEATDPRAFSSRPDGIADGYLVWFGLDPHDPQVGRTTPAEDGLTVAQAYTISQETCEQESATEECNWRQRLQAGQVIDPTWWDSIGDGIPDAWAVQHMDGGAHPLHDGDGIVVDDTASWDASIWDEDPTSLEGVLIDPLNPEPAAFEVSLLDAYRHHRPQSWDEEADGPWWDGLPPDLETPAGALPPAVALRGWQLAFDTGLGRNSTEGASASDMHQVVARGDPRNADTDGDGIDDRHEYYGLQQDGTPSHRTDPNNADTDGDGLPDDDEILEYHTHPMRMDTSGSFLTDGQEVDYWSGRMDDALEALAALPARDLEEAYGWLLWPDESRLGVQQMERLGPSGVLLDGNKPNVLTRDADGDGIPDGAERFPNKFLNEPTSHARPATDPARSDSDGDGLPDAWEIRWSKDEFYDGGWPLDPSQWNSLDPGADRSDFWNNLAGDVVTPSAGAPAVQFNNGLAYRYGLHPFERDSAGDGIPDMFALHWGVFRENIPEWAIERAAEDPEFDWALDAANRVTDNLAKTGSTSESPTMVFIDPYGVAPTGPESNLLGTFSDREKGTWIVRPDLTLGEDDGCDADALPENGPRRESGLEGIPGRSLQASCWIWVDYPLASDIDNSTNPWSHDFDGDGLPDAWERHYQPSGGVDAGDPTPGSKDGDCETANRAGLPSLDELGKNSYCLTWQESYERGLDPLTEDTDGGGIPDWIEVAISSLEGGEGLDPLDPDDDRREEDWDGDGLPNYVESLIGTSRLSPDSDGDGLLDGNATAGIFDEEDTPAFIDSKKGAGDLCLRRGDDNVTNMEHRPHQAGLGSGNLTHTALFEHMVSLGILHDPGGEACSEMEGSDEEYFLFKREGIVDEWTQPSGRPIVIGAGRGTDPLSWDTSGDGIPDGWLVYWRDRTADGDDPTKRALDPNRNSASSNPDGDLITGVEYAMARPPGWDEAVHGPWWGGLDPRQKDTDGDEDWFTRRVSGQDALDKDNDADGIPDVIDPHPALDPHNEGIVGLTRSDGGGIDVVTDFPALWRSLEDRPTFGQSDEDNDTVPLFLDRARVEIVDRQVTGEGGDLTVDKGEATLTIEGTLRLDEEPLDVTYDDETNGADVATGNKSVRGATVKAILSDGETTSVAGYGFSGENGTFSFTATIDDTAPGSPGDGRDASVGGRLINSSQPPALPSTALGLSPGPVELYVVVEPNHPGQALDFGTTDDERPQVAAYKDAPFSIPSLEPGTSGLEVRAVAMDGDGDPDTDAKHVKHATGTIFGTHSDPVVLVLRSEARLSMDPSAGKIGAAEPFEVSGRLLDADKVPLAGRNITLSLTHEGQPVKTGWDHTGDDGSFLFLLDGNETREIGPGVYTVDVKADLLEEDTFLTPPDDETASLVIVEELQWVEDVLVDDEETILSAVVPAMDVTTPWTVEMRLIDAVEEMPVSGRDLAFRLSTLRDDVVVDAGTTVSGDNGTVLLELGPLSAATPRDLLRLTVEAVPLTPGHEKTPSAQILFEPAYPTRIQVSDVTLPADEGGHLHGVLLRKSGQEQVPVVDPGVQIIARPPQGDLLNVTGTSDDGFAIPVAPGRPGNEVWDVFAPADAERYLAGAPMVQVNVTYFTPTTLATDDAAALTGEPVDVAVRLQLPDGTPVPDARLQAAWTAGATGNASGTTDQNGTAVLNLSALPAPGEAAYKVWFEGNTTHGPAQLNGTAAVSARSEIRLEATPFHMDSTGMTNGSVLATLRNETGHRLVGRAVDVEIQGPQGMREETTRVSDSEGKTRIGPEDLDAPAPGNWTFTFRFRGGEHQAAAVNQTTVRWVHEASFDLDRSPFKVNAGRSVSYAGTLGTADAPVPDATVVLAIDGKEVAQGRTRTPDGAWSIPFQVPDLAVGDHVVTLSARGVPDVDVQELQTDLRVVRAVSASLERVSEDGTTYEVTATDGSGAPVAGVQMVLAQLDPSGQVHGLYEVETGPLGTATLSVAETANGTLVVHAVTSPDHALAVDDTNSIQAQVVTDPGTGKVIGVVVMSAAAVLVAASVVAYTLWRRRHRSAIQQAFAQAQQELLDTNVPPDEVVRRVYRRLLATLQDAGFELRATQTARDVADEAIRAFGLAVRPMQEATLLFEQVVYTDRPLGPVHRKKALAAFQGLTEVKKDRFRLRRAGRGRS